MGDNVSDFWGVQRSNVSEEDIVKHRKFDENISTTDKDLFI